MDGMEKLAGTFGGMGMPFFSPLSMVNMSGTCATSRILQLRYLGLYLCLVEDKIAKEARAGDPDFKLRQRCVEAVKKLCDPDNEYGCVLWQWQICEGAAKRESDYGELVFCDGTTKRFLVIETRQQWDESAWEHSKAMAKQLFCMLRYVGYAPHHVRYAVFCADRPKTYFSYFSKQEQLSAALTKAENPGPLEPEHPGPTSFGQIDVSNCPPALTSSIVSKIDVILSRNKTSLQCAQTARQKDGLTKEKLLGEIVMQNKDGASASKEKAAEPKLTQSCAFCQSTAEEKNVDKLRRCGRCLIPYYCGIECQRAHYKLHKVYCKQAAG